GGKAYSEEVMEDIRSAQQVGARGVPFFVFDGKYAVSGAQESKVFLQALEKSFGEWASTKDMQATNGEVCTPDGDCK
ncbi:MAG: oxidoreductase, partial [Bacteroidota bacterium]|nr:oxidoreductase [Bacteroidota bacterium]